MIFPELTLLCIKKGFMQFPVFLHTCFIQKFSFPVSGFCKKPSSGTFNAPGMPESV